MSLPNEQRVAAARIKALVLDVDGVLTDGRLQYTAEGEQVKTFHVRDGLGIRLLLENGVDVAILTARDSPALTRRADDLGIKHVLRGRRDKRRALAELRERLGLNADEVAFVGDDLLDVPALESVGLPISVADAHDSAKRAARWVTARPGGMGAVREIADALLDARGQLEAAESRILELASQGV